MRYYRLRVIKSKLKKKKRAKRRLQVYLFWCIFLLCVVMFFSFFLSLLLRWLHGLCCWLSLTRTGSLSVKGKDIESCWCCCSTSSNNNNKKNNTSTTYTVWPSIISVRFRLFCVVELWIHAAAEKKQILFKFAFCKFMFCLFLAKKKTKWDKQKKKLKKYQLISKVVHLSDIICLPNVCTRAKPTATAAAATAHSCPRYTFLQIYASTFFSLSLPKNWKKQKKRNK